MKLLHLLQLTLIGGLVFGSLACTGSSQKESVNIEINKQTVPMGRSVTVTAHVNIKPGNSTNDYLLLPYVNQRRWGSHERPDPGGNATFLLPLPNPGKNIIQVVAVKAEPGNWMGSSRSDFLMVGSYLPDTGIFSEEITVAVEKRSMPAAQNEGHLFCIQWEPWFTNSSHSWHGAEAVPVIGLYDSYNEDAIRQHVLWFMDLGVDFIMPDWSNHIWSKKHWNEIDNGARAIVHATTCFLEVLAKMRVEGLDVPKVALMPGLSNGPPATMTALNEQLEWIYQNYVLNPRFKGLFQDYDGKPLMLILDTGAVGHKKGTTKSAFTVPFFEMTLSLKEQELDAFRRNQEQVDDTHFTIRYVSSQNQVTRHHELGYWSWMDGQLEPLVTYYDGKPEAVTVTPAFFGLMGWTAPEAYGKRGGTTYIESFKYAFKSEPRVVFLHQFNEFAGQGEGHGYGKNHDIYLDEHSMEFSDDIEPVSLTAAGLRDSTGGWGFYYLNMTRALMDMFNGRDRNSTIMAARISDVNRQSAKLEWSVAGPEPKTYTVKVDGKVIPGEISGASCEVPIGDLAKGVHTITITANDAHTYYALSKTEYDEIPAEPLPVTVNLQINF